MRNIINKGLLLLSTSFAVIACDPYEKDKYELGSVESITESGISFDYTASETSENILVFTNTSKYNQPVATRWDFGNGATSQASSAEAVYPQSGEYEVSLTLYAANGTSATKKQTITIDTDDFSLLDKPVYNMLTGGMDNVEGKVWQIDRYNLYTAEVAAATGYNIGGHMGLGSQGSYSQEWWSAEPDSKSDWKFYPTTFNFVHDGLKLNIATEGLGYGRNASSSSIGGFTVVEAFGDDVSFEYEGGSYSFSISESGKYPVMTLSDNAFLGLYCGTQSYEIIYQTDSVFAIRVNNTTESQDWVFVYTLESLNTAP